METIFVNVDTQKDFMKKDEEHQGTLYIAEAETLEVNLGYLTQLALARGITVVNTADWHTKDSKEFSENPDYANTFPAHCIQNTPGAEYIDATQPHAGVYTIDWRDDRVDHRALELAQNIVLRKDAFNVFEGNPHTDSVYEFLNPDRAIVYGVATDVCVDQHVKGLLERGVEVYAVKDAMKEIPIRPLEETLQGWTDQGVKLIETTEVRDYLR